MPSFQEKLARFVEEEKLAGVDQELLTRLHTFLADETLYWDMPPERRKTLNAFYKELHGILDTELISGKFGASIVIDSFIVTVFECGLRFGLSEPK